jgi:hypothetical protein
MQNLDAEGNAFDLSRSRLTRQKRRDGTAYKVSVVNFMVIGFDVRQGVAILLPWTDHVWKGTVRLTESIERNNVLASIFLPNFSPNFTLSIEPLQHPLSLVCPPRR